jgi:hypothetical protein
MLIFSSLADRFRNNDDIKIKDSILKLLFDLVERRKDTISQMVLFLKGVPETMIPLMTVSRLVAITLGREEEKAVDALLQEWSTNKLNLSLAKAAATQLRRKVERKQ